MTRKGGGSRGTGPGLPKMMLGQTGGAGCRPGSSRPGSSPGLRQEAVPASTTWQERGACTRPGAGALGHHSQLFPILRSPGALSPPPLPAPPPSSSSSSPEPTAPEWLCSDLRSLQSHPGCSLCLECPSSLGVSSSRPLWVGLLGPRGFQAPLPQPHWCLRICPQDT